MAEEPARAMIRVSAQEEDCIQLGGLIRRFADRHIIRLYRHAPAARAPATSRGLEYRTGTDVDGRSVR